MKKILLPAFGLFLTFSAKADTINCSFTEPFIVTSYSMAEQTLTYVNPIGKNGKEEVSVINNVSFQIQAAGVFELVSKDGKVLQTLKLNYNGSDGMSDTVYPYDVKDNSPIMTSNMGFGGCTSNNLKAKEDRK